MKKPTKKVKETFEPFFRIDNSVVGTWRVPFKDSNFIATVNKLSNNEYEMKWRWRYYVDDKVGAESNDRKKWSRLIAKSNEEEMIQKVRAVVRATVAAADEATHYNEILMGEDGLEAFTAKLLALDGMHVVKA